MATITQVWQTTYEVFQISVIPTNWVAASKPKALGMANRAHKMYFLCKTNPKSRRQKIGLTDYITRSYVVFGHLVNGTNKPKQTQSNPIVARPSWPRCHRPLAGDNLWVPFTHPDVVISESACLVNGYSSFYPVWS